MTFDLLTRKKNMTLTFGSGGPYGVSLDDLGVSLDDLGVWPSLVGAARPLLELRSWVALTTLLTVITFAQ